jgi:hypothetical protein
MTEPADHRPRAKRQLLVIAALIGLGYVCARTLRFTNDGFNLAFQCGFFLLPFFAIWPLHRLCPGLRGVVVGLFLAPVLVLSLLCLLSTALFYIPVYVRDGQLSQELGRVQEEHYSVHLVWEERGALGFLDVGLEQRMFIVPGLYMVKHVDHFEDAYGGSLSAEGPDKVRVYIPNRNPRQDVNKVYTLKHRLYW